MLTNEIVIQNRTFMRDLWGIAHGSRRVIASDAGLLQPTDLSTRLWSTLATISELVRVGSYEFLQLPDSAAFPLEGSNVTHRLLVRQCYKDLVDLLVHHASTGGHSFIIAGNPGQLLAVRRLIYRIPAQTVCRA